jgi:type 1 glutamine amidotransferase
VLKGRIMRTSSICAASFALVAWVAGCSDGSGQLDGSGGATTMSTSGTPGTAGTGLLPGAGTSSTGGNANTTGGGTTDAGSGTTAAGTSTGGVTSGGTGGASAGTGPTTGGSGGSAGSTTVDNYSGKFKILVLDYTLDFHHDSIPICDLMLGLESNRAAVEADRKKTEPPNLGVTPDAMMPAGTKPGSQWTAELAAPELTQFTDANLKNYAMVFSCNPTGTVFSGNPKVADKAVPMAALQKFVEGGGAWGGVHSATDFEKANGYPWFTNLLVGGYFDHHDNDGTSGTVQLAQMFANHPVVKGVQTTWSTQDEWYYMNRDVSAQPGFQILERLASDNRPVTWVKEFGMGRMFYTIRGHNKSVYEEPDFRKLVLNGILWATHRLN